MKLFQKLLIAPAALGLLSPIAATANEINLSEVSGYASTEDVQNINEFNAKELAVTNSRVDGLEARLNNFEAGSFSETTTASFSADFAIGAVDGSSDTEAVTTAYGFQIDLNTSFTGNDSLDVSIDAGNGTSGNLDELDLNAAGSTLTVDGLSYTFPLGDKATVFVGDNTPGSKLYNTACVYGGQTDTLDDCGAASSALDPEFGTSAGASFDFGDGFTAAIGYEGQGNSSSGILTKEGTDAYGLQLTYTDDSFGASVSYADVEGTTDTTYWALNGYWTPESTGNVPSISVGYEFGNPATGNDTTQYFVGLQWDEVGPGTVGAAIGSTGAIADGATETTMYELFYSYPINDGMTVTPVFYSKEVSGADDHSGFIVKTSFIF